MLSHLRGSIQAFLLSLTLAASAHGGDILANGDFSDGKTHWRGNGEAATGGLVITLNPDKWTAVCQRFNATDKALKLIVTYSLSQDCSLGRKNDTLVAPLTPEALNAACEVDGPFNLPLHKGELWKVLVMSYGLLLSESSVPKSDDSPTVDNPAPTKTYTADLSPSFGSFQDCYLCFCFPPGQGSITLQGAKLLPPGQ